MSQSAVGELFEVSLADKVECEMDDVSLEDQIEFAKKLERVVIALLFSDKKTTNERDFDDLGRMRAVLRTLEGLR